jgi:hypothetical protein
MAGFSGSAYAIDFLTINSPAKGNMPSFRSLSFNIAAQQIAAGTIARSNIYFVNQETRQVAAFFPPTPVLGYASIIQGSIPFFMKSNQSLYVYFSNGVAGFDDNIVYNVSASALTYEVPSYLTIMGE